MNIPLPVEMTIVVYIVFGIAGLIVNLAFAFAVAVDGGRLPGRARPVFVGQTIWFIATLFGGPFMAATYWLIHHSMLSPFVANSVQRRPME